MSFSYDVKSEVAAADIKARHCKLAVLAGLLLCGTTDSSKDALILTTEHEATARLCIELLRELIATDGSGLELTRGRYNSRVVMSGAENIHRLKDVFKLEECDGDFRINIDRLDLNKGCCKNAFVSGCFLGGGSLSDPDRGYHFELIMSNEAAAVATAALLTGVGVKARVIKRKSNYITYAKDSDSIAQLLLMIQGINSLMKLENVRINKQMRNDINRSVNFEASNICRSATAVDRQLQAIRLIDEKMGLMRLDKALQEVIELRTAHPDSSLQELSELSNGLTKSCINHRLRKIREIAESLSRA